jgi:hypothetical protein
MLHCLAILSSFDVGRVQNKGDKPEYQTRIQLPICKANHASVHINKANSMPSAWYVLGRLISHAMNKQIAMQNNKSQSQKLDIHEVRKFCSGIT